jgi:hypothetical protein
VKLTDFGFAKVIELLGPFWGSSHAVGVGDGMAILIGNMLINQCFFLLPDFFRQTLIFSKRVMNNKQPQWFLGPKLRMIKSPLGLRVNQVMFSPFEEDSEGKQGTRILGYSTVTDGRKSGN